jgi:hypothetical protein
MFCTPVYNCHQFEGEYIIGYVLYVAENRERIHKVSACQRDKRKQGHSSDFPPDVFEAGTDGEEMLEWSWRKPRHHRVSPPLLSVLSIPGSYTTHPVGHPVSSSNGVQPWPLLSTARTQITIYI